MVQVLKKTDNSQKKKMVCPIWREVLSISDLANPRQQGPVTPAHDAANPALRAPADVGLRPAWREASRRIRRAPSPSSPPTRPPHTRPALAHAHSGRRGSRPGVGAAPDIRTLRSGAAEARLREVGHAGGSRAGPTRTVCPSRDQPQPPPHPGPARAGPSRSVDGTTRAGLGRSDDSPCQPPSLLTVTPDAPTPPRPSRPPPIPRSRRWPARARNAPQAA